MAEVCKKCGLPLDFCVCEDISKEAQKIAVRSEKRRFNKWVTTVTGFDPKTIDIEDVAKKLKQKLACGGTMKDGIIELQGDHKKRIVPVLTGLGFPANSIDLR